MLLVWVLADKSHLCIFVFQKCSYFDKIKVIWDKKNRVALIVFVERIPDSLGEELETRGVDVFKGTDIWKSSQGELYMLVSAYIKSSVWVYFGKLDWTQDVWITILVVYEFHICILELLDNYVLPCIFRHLGRLLRIHVSQTCDIVQFWELLWSLVYHFEELLYMFWILKYETLSLIKNQVFDAREKIEINFHIFCCSFICLLASHQSHSQRRCNNNVTLIKMLIKPQLRCLCLHAMLYRYSNFKIVRKCLLIVPIVMFEFLPFAHSLPFTVVGE